MSGRTSASCHYSNKSSWPAFFQSPLADVQELHEHSQEPSLQKVRMSGARHEVNALLPLLRLPTARMAGREPEHDLFPKAFRQGPCTTTAGCHCCRSLHCTTASLVAAKPASKPCLFSGSLLLGLLTSAGIFAYHNICIWRTFFFVQTKLPCKVYGQTCFRYWSSVQLIALLVILIMKKKKQQKN